MKEKPIFVSLMSTDPIIYHSSSETLKDRLEKRRRLRQKNLSKDNQSFSNATPTKTSSFDRQSSNVRPVQSVISNQTSHSSPTRLPITNRPISSRETPLLAIEKTQSMPILVEKFVRQPSAIRQKSARIDDKVNNEEPIISVQTVVNEQTNANKPEITARNSSPSPPTVRPRRKLTTPVPIPRSTSHEITSISRRLVYEQPNSSWSLSNSLALSYVFNNRLIQAHFRDSSQPNINKHSNKTSWD